MRILHRDLFRKTLELNTLFYGMTPHQFFLYNLQGHLDALLRGLVLGVMGRSGDAATITEARKRFDAHCNGESTVPADLRSAVYGTVLRHGDAATLDAVMKLFREADLHEEKVRLMRTMGAVSQPELIKKVLDFSLSVSEAFLYCTCSTIIFPPLTNDIIVLYGI